MLDRHHQCLGPGEVIGNGYVALRTPGDHNPLSVDTGQISVLELERRTDAPDSSASVSRASKGRTIPIRRDDGGACTGGCPVEAWACQCQ